MSVQKHLRIKIQVIRPYETNNIHVYVKTEISNFAIENRRESQVKTFGDTNMPLE